MPNSLATRDKIIRNAITLFNKKGYRATSLSDITKALGMSKGAIYGNFLNKEEVAIASFDYAVNKVINQLSADISAQKTAPLKLKAILNYYEKYIEKPPIEGGCPIINTSVEADDNHPDLRLRVVHTITRIKDALKKVIARGIKEGQLRENIDIELYATMFYAAIEGGIVMARVEGNIKSYSLIKKGLEMQIDALTK
ncbi:MAG: TetR/AcrR family transcriptional regulator [Cyclobacteriaceae bacterium]